MPNLHVGVDLPWDGGSTLHAAGPSLPWGAGVTLHATPSVYVPGPPPPGGTPTYPMPPSVLEIQARPVYSVVHNVSAVDLRDGSPLDLFDLSIATDASSTYWTLSANGAGSLYSTLTSGDQPAQIEVTIDGAVWRFAVDSVSRSRQFGADAVSLAGRSLTVAASSPYQIESNWVNDGDTTAAQMAAIANLYTALGVDWMLDDWIIPDKVFTFSGTPLGVVLRLAEAVGAVVTSDRADYRVRVLPRYPVLPQQWMTTPADVRVAFDAVLAESFERADAPEYDGVYLSGQQGGVIGFVRLAGTAGASLHPLVTDLLLTEAPAVRQRGEAILGASGGQARVRVTLPVLTGPNEPGVLDLHQLVHMADPANPWIGLVRGVSVSASAVGRDARVRQVVELERHTRLLAGTYVPLAPVSPLVLNNIDDVGSDAWDPTWWEFGALVSGGVPPYTWSLASGSLPAFLTLDPDVGEITGNAGGTTWDDVLVLRVTDSTGATVDSNPFTAELYLS